MDVKKEMQNATSEGNQIGVSTPDTGKYMEIAPISLSKPVLRTGVTYRTIRL